MHIQRSRHWLGPGQQCCQQKDRHCYSRSHFPRRTKVQQESVSSSAPTIKPTHTIRFFIGCRQQTYWIQENLSRAAGGRSQRQRLQLRVAEGNVSCFYQREDFVAGLQFHFLDRARCNDRRNFADAGLHHYFTKDFVGHDAFHRSGELVSNALFHR